VDCKHAILHRQLDGTYNCRVCGKNVGVISFTEFVSPGTGIIFS
jgi:hypothetical protein